MKEISKLKNLFKIWKGRNQFGNLNFIYKLDVLIYNTFRLNNI